MEEIIKEYGGVMLGIFGGIAILGIFTKLVFSGGILGELLIKLGNMAC